MARRRRHSRNGPRTVIASILYIEDSEFDRELFEAHFSAIAPAGMVLTCVGTVEAGCTEIRARLPALLFLDSAVPPYQSFSESLGPIRAAGYGGQVVIVTGHAVPEMLEEAAAVGAGPVLDKWSLGPDQLRRLIAGSQP